MTEDGYQKGANKKDFQGDNRLVRVELNGKSIVLSKVNGKVYAMDAVCSHEGGPLEDDSLDGYELKCPCHYAIFDVRNPKASEETVWATDLKSYSVKVDEVSGDIMVSPEPKSPETAIQNESTTTVPKEAKKQSGSYSGLTLTKKQELEGIDIMTFKSKKDRYPEYKAGQFAFFPLDTVNNYSRDPVRHFLLASLLSDINNCNNFLVLA
jgi:glycine betaine catabolism B